MEDANFLGEHLTWLKAAGNMGSRIFSGNSSPSALFFVMFWFFFNKSNSLINCRLSIVGVFCSLLCGQSLWQSPSSSNSCTKNTGERQSIITGSLFCSTQEIHYVSLSNSDIVISRKYQQLYRQAEKERSGTDTYWFLQCQKTMAHPAACRSVAADVRETFLVVPIWCTEWDLLYGLVHYQTLKRNCGSLKIDFG